MEKRFPQLAVPGTPASRLTNPIDGKRDFIAVARVRDTPLVLAVTREEDLAMGVRPHDLGGGPGRWRLGDLSDLGDLRT